MILVIDRDSTKEDAWEELEVLTDITMAKLVHGKPYTYPTLTLSKGNEVVKLNKEAYLFDISKAD